MINVGNYDGYSNGNAFFLHFLCIIIVAMIVVTNDGYNDKSCLLARATEPTTIL